MKDSTESQFPLLDRAAVLSALEECTDALAIFQYTLKKPSVHIGIDIDCIPPEVRYQFLKCMYFLLNLS